VKKYAVTLSASRQGRLKTGVIRENKITPQ